MTSTLAQRLPLLSNGRSLPPNPCIQRPHLKRLNYSRLYIFCNTSPVTGVREEKRNKFSSAFTGSQGVEHGWWTAHSLDSGAGD